MTFPITFGVFMPQGEWTLYSDARGRPICPVDLGYVATIGACSGPATVVAVVWQGIGVEHTMTSNTAVVTGAASGIGRALATQLRARHERLVVADIDEAALRSVATELDATAVVTDVSDPAAVENLAEVAGAPAMLCLNAGVLSQDLGAPWESTPDDWRRVFDINVGGVANGLRAFVPRMLAADEPAAILITASLAGLLTWPGGGPYGASKHAVVAVAEAAALALDGTPILVTTLCPALVRSGMSDVGADPADVAGGALAALARGEFLVTPDEWHDAIAARAASLITGGRPTIPGSSDDLSHR